jgi:hypothetical protein
MYLIICTIVGCIPAALAVMVLLRASRRAASRRSAERELLSSSVQVLRTEIGTLRRRLDEFELAQLERQAALVPQQSINTNKRAQILRMARRGETAEHISAALSVPANEVSLALKVQRMLVDGAA